MRARVEFTVEPFVEGTPGSHVTAAVDAVAATGLRAEIGPFGTTVEGDTASVVTAVAALLDAAAVSGADRVSMQVTFTDD